MTRWRDSRSETKKMIHQLACCVLLSQCVPSIKLSRSYLLCWRHSFFWCANKTKRSAFCQYVLHNLLPFYQVECSTFNFNVQLLYYCIISNTGPSVTGVGGLWYGTVHSATCTAWTWRDLVAKCSLEQPLNLDLVQRGGTVVSAMALQQEGLNPRPAAQDPSVWNVHVLPVFVGFSSGCSAHYGSDSGLTVTGGF